MLLDKKKEANMTEIYKSFEILSRDFQKIEEFVEKFSEDNDDANIEHFVEGAQQLSDSVDQLSKEILNLPNAVK